MKEIKIRKFLFSEQELQGKNPYNDSNGNPKDGMVEKSYAWAEAASLFRREFEKEPEPNEQIEKF